MYRSKKRSVRVDLVGGLGNQLFCYFAGLHLSHYTSRELYLSQENIDRKHTAGKYGLNSIEVRGKLLSPPSTFRRLVRRIPVATSVRLKYYFQLINLPFVSKKYVPEIFNDYLEKMPHFRNTKSQLQLRGYFQDFEFVTDLPRDFREVRLKRPSLEFIRDLDYLSKHKVAAVHLRLGDFLEGNNPNAIGNLDRSWYERVLDLANTDNDYDEVWVFSNDVHAAQLFFDFKLNTNFRFMESSQKKDPAEDLMLMANASCVVAANSTFSLWGSYLGKQGKVVYFPQPLTRNGMNEVRGFPEDWIPVPSIWKAI